MNTTLSNSQTAEPIQQYDDEISDDLPPSAKLVLKVLEYEGRLTQAAIAEASRLPRRTVRDALDRLMAVDIVDREPYFRDARQSLYSIRVP